jgi:lipid A 3-O-deacylase
MRVRPILGSGVALAFLAHAAGAADLGFTPPSQPMSFVSELRIGASAQDPWSPEKGSANLTGEVVFAKPFTTADLFTSYFVPRPHLGGSLNTRGETSFGYAGLTWTVDITQRIFVEASFGGALHSGNTQSNPALIPADRTALGCSPVFRESGSVGFRLSQNWSVMATVEHMSNLGACTQNRGLTNVGARLGYSF